MFGKALDHSITAGDMATSCYAHLEAIRYYDISLRCLESVALDNKDEKIIEVLVKKARNWNVIGEWTEAVDAYKQALSLADGLGNRDITKALRGDLGLIYMRKSMWKDSLECFEDLLKMSTEDNNVVEIANASFGIAMVSYKKGDYPVAIGEYKKVIEGISGLEDEQKKPHLGRFTRMLGAAHYRMGELEEAGKCFQESLRIYTGLGDDFEIGVTKHRLGMLANRKGEYDSAISYYGDALAKFEEIGNVFQMSKNLINLGESYFNQGKTELALENYKKAEEIDRRMGNEYGLAISVGLQGKVHTSLKNYELARELFEENLRICERLENRYGFGMAKRDLGVLNYLIGNLEESINDLEEACELFDQIKSQEKNEAEVLLGLIIREKDEPRGAEIVARYEGTRELEKAKKKLAQ